MPPPSPTGADVPVAPPPTRLGVYVGAGCGLAFVLATVVSFVGLLAVRSASPASPASRPVPRAAAPSPVAAPAPLFPSGDADAEVVDLRMFDGDSRGTSHVFVAEIQSTGDVPIAAPHAVVSAFDAAGLLLQTCTCASVVRELAPGDKVPCSCAMRRAGTIASHRADISAEPAVARGRAPGLEVSDLVFTASDGRAPHELRGRVTNRSAFRAASAWAIVTLYGHDGKIVGMNEATVDGVGIDAGKSAAFSAKVGAVFAPPDAYAVKAVGYE